MQMFLPYVITSCYVLNDATVCMNALVVLYNNYNISQIIGLVEVYIKCYVYYSVKSRTC